MKTINSFISEKLKITKKMLDNQYDYIDLDLPSGTLWAKCNVGAKKETEFGDYYAWGEIETKEEYTWETYKYGEENNVTKYTKQDKLEELELEDDVAYTYGKDDWHIPTTEQFRELKEHTRYKWHDNYNDSGINGILFTGENGNTIFLPATGYKHGNVVRYNNIDGGYWSKNVYTDKRDRAEGLEFNSKYTTICTTYRCCGYSVRPVLNK